MPVQVSLKSIKHRAVCTTGRWKGSWRNSEEKAYADGNKHISSKPDHDFEVETKQVFRKSRN